MPRSAPSVACATCHPCVLGADEVGGGDLHVVEEHLAEVRIPDRVADRPHLDSGRRHVQQEVRNALAFGGIGIGAGQQQTPVGVHTAAGPQLLTVDDEGVAVTPRGRAQAGQIGSGLRFGEALHPDLPVEDRRKVAAALFFGTRDQQGGRGVVDSDEREHQPRRIVGGQLLVQHHLLGDRQPAAPFAGPVRDGEAGAVQLGEPRLLERDEFLVGCAGLGLTPIARDVVGAPRAHLLPKLSLCTRIP